MTQKIHGLPTIHSAYSDNANDAHNVLLVNHKKPTNSFSKLNFIAAPNKSSNYKLIFYVTKKKLSKALMSQQMDTMWPAICR